jgi:hypothetical protein
MIDGSMADENAWVLGKSGEEASSDSTTTSSEGCLVNLASFRIGPSVVGELG